MTLNCEFNICNRCEHYITNNGCCCDEPMPMYCECKNIKYNKYIIKLFKEKKLDNECVELINRLLLIAYEKIIINYDNLNKVFTGEILNHAKAQKIKYIIKFENTGKTGLLFSYKNVDKDINKSIGITAIIEYLCFEIYDLIKNIDNITVDNIRTAIKNDKELIYIF